MSKEVKRYDPFGYDGLSALMHEDADGGWVRVENYDALRLELTEANADFVRIANDREALLAERDALILQIDTLTEWYSNSLEVIREITAALPGAYYMDPPDGGDVSVPEQVRRMAKDAERTRMRVKELDLLFGRYLLAMKAAVIDADQRGDEEGMRWIYNSLAGPGELPAEDEIDAQAFFDREIKSIDDGMAEVMAYHRAALQGEQL